MAVAGWIQHRPHRTTTSGVPRTSSPSHWSTVAKPANEGAGRRWYFSPTWNLHKWAKPGLCWPLQKTISFCPGRSALLCRDAKTQAWLRLTVGNSRKLNEQNLHKTLCVLCPITTITQEATRNYYTDYTLGPANQHSHSENHYNVFLLVLQTIHRFYNRFSQSRGRPLKGPYPG